MDSVDNIFIGHDEAQAKAFAKETYHVKKPIEQEAEGSAPEEDDEEGSTLVDKVRLRVYEFIRESIPPSPV
jgi:calnexin